MYKLEQIHWVDHYSVQGWQQPPEDTLEYVAETVGYNVLENERYVCLAQTYSPDAVADIMYIIKNDIVDRREILVKKYTMKSIKDEKATS